MESCIEDVSTRLSCLSIVVDDVDGRRNRSQNHCKKEETPKTEQKNHQSQEQVSQSVQNPYPRHVLEDAIRDILEEAELRKFEFRKLIDEHDALVKNLKKMEKENSSTSTYLHSPIMT
ncbi:unnamed protein product [Psylliodes chrysocephalus]|uniref:Uncharacterized protein n=1 Tax=Psylliodes chrysocephalus TaxID=3402493 RepID=A0A9P0D156_9CUCU|nr:unnamed protein product [Psylliodes chrysocephala]